MMTATMTITMDDESILYLVARLISYQLLFMASTTAANTKHVAIAVSVRYVPVSPAASSTAKNIQLATLENIAASRASKGTTSLQKYQNTILNTEVSASVHFAVAPSFCNVVCPSPQYRA